MRPRPSIRRHPRLRWRVRPRNWSSALERVRGPHKPRQTRTSLSFFHLQLHPLTKFLIAMSGFDGIAKVTSRPGYKSKDTDFSVSEKAAYPELGDSLDQT